MLIFAGDQDLLCNYVGLEAMIAGLEWGGGRGLGEVEWRGWWVGSQGEGKGEGEWEERQAGTWVESRGLSYAKVPPSLTPSLPFIMLKGVDIGMS